MLSTYVRVPHGTDPKEAATNEILGAAQKEHVFLTRPLDLKLTCTTGGTAQLAAVMGLEPDQGHDVYRVDSDTVPCPHT
ncbi:hypothetical protein ACFYO9_34015 [Streptomyces sp. NPDC005863]|uniref:hypothetical protein n=1 Tax=Streptomyces sp. NPDC005863 TaxID=3364735 RepID=UPI00369D44AC